MESEYGLLDPKDRTWLGNDDGPLVYRDCVINGKEIAGQMLAVLAAAVAAKALGREVCAEKYRCPNPVLKDHIDTLMTPLEALKLLEKEAL